MPNVLTYDDVFAAERSRPYVHGTPIFTNKALSATTGAELLLKCESFQRTESFKACGGCNSVYSLSDSEAARGVAIHPLGNHAQAITCTARAGIRWTCLIISNFDHKEILDWYDLRRQQCVMRPWGITP